MDYEALLRKYMALVIDREGYDFIDDAYGVHHTHDPELTDDEVAELRRIAREVDADPAWGRG